MIKRKLLQSILWIMTISCLLFINKEKFQFNVPLVSDVNEKIKLSKQNQEYANYTKLMFAIHNNETDEISKLASNIKKKSKTHFLVIELLDSFNYDLALKKATQLNDESIKTHLLGFEEFINKNFKKSKKYFENEKSIIGKMAYFLSNRELDENYKIPKELKKYEKFIEKSNYNSHEILSIMLSANDELIPLLFAYKINPNNENALFKISNLLLNKKAYSTLIKFAKDLPNERIHNIIRTQLIDAIPAQKKYCINAIMESINQDDPYYYIALSIKQKKQKHYKKSLESIKKARGINNDYFYLLNYAIALEKNNLFKQSIDKLKIANKLSNSKPHIASYLHYLSIEQNINLDKSLNELLIAYKNLPTPYIADSVGWAYYKLGKYEKALIYLEKSATELSTDGVVNEHLGNVYLKLGRTREAIFQWQRVIDLDATNEYINIDEIKSKIIKYDN